MTREQPVALLPTQRLQLWRFLATEKARPLRLEIERDPPRSVSDFSRLRKRYPAEWVSLATGLMEARRLLHEKFPPELVAAAPAEWWGDVEGAEQATRWRVAQLKAARFPQGDGWIVDACSGIGGDTLALCQRSDVVAIDRDPVRVWMSRRNVSGAAHRCDALCSAVEDVDLPARVWFHCDPARRADGQRLWRLQDLRPSLTALTPILQRVRGAAIKLGPGTVLEELAELPIEHEVELVSYDGELTQLILWSGELRRTERSATWLARDGRGGSYQGIPSASRPQWDRADVPSLYLADPALERSQLVGGYVEERTSWGELAPGLGIFAGDRDSCVDGFDEYRVVAELPWRIDKVKRWLREHDAGEVRVKTRGRALDSKSGDANQIQRRLSKTSGQTYLLFILRLGREIRCYICEA